MSKASNDSVLMYGLAGRCVTFAFSRAQQCLYQSERFSLTFMQIIGKYKSLYDTTPQHNKKYSQWYNYQTTLPQEFSEYWNKVALHYHPKSPTLILPYSLKWQTDNCDTIT